MMVTRVWHCSPAFPEFSAPHCRPPQLAGSSALPALAPAPHRPYVPCPLVSECASRCGGSSRSLLGCGTPTSPLCVRLTTRKRNQLSVFGGSSVWRRLTADVSLCQAAISWKGPLDSWFQVSRGAPRPPVADTGPLWHGSCSWRRSERADV